jgi:hypothetical protein
MSDNVERAKPGSRARELAASLREEAFKLPPSEQYWLASMIAENVGYVLAKPLD